MNHLQITPAEPKIYELNAHQSFLRLRRGSWFGGLPFKVANAIFHAGIVKRYRPGDVIYREGDVAGGLYGMLNGAVHLDMITRAGNRILVDVALPGSWFGDTETKAIVGARACTDVRLWRVTSQALRTRLRSEPEIADAIGSLAEKRLMTFLEMLCLTQRNTALGQVAAWLYRLNRLQQDNDPHTEGTTIHLTQSDLADMTGHSRQTVNAAVSQLKRQGAVRVLHRRIEICDPDALWAHSCAERS